MNLFIVIQKQARVIDNIENGKYSAGIKQCNIPAMDKPNFPSRDTFPILYKSMSNSKSLASFKSKGRAAEKFRT